MNPQLRFNLCLSLASLIVSAARAEAPEGCDPQNTWVAVGVGVAGVATSAYTASQANKSQEQIASRYQPVKVDPVTFRPMPSYIPANFDKLDQATAAADRAAYLRSDADFAARHPELLGAERQFEHNAALDQAGDHALIPQMQAEAINAGLGSALDAFGDSGPVLARGSGAEADVAKNLGLSIAGFQDRNRANAERSLSLAEQIFPRRQIGSSGAEAGQVMLGNLSAQNAWNQADYAAKSDQDMFNAQLQAGNVAREVQTGNATAQAQAQADAAKTELYANAAKTAITSGFQAYGNYKAANPPAARPTVTSITQRKA